ncbi:hypothetical protein Aperf_G00000024857 [Anoplocephala perfoliata]
MPDRYYHMKDKIKDIASQLGSNVKPFWSEFDDGPCYIWPGNPNWTLKKLYSLADMNRAALPSSFTVSLDRRLGAITDDQSRITLIDLHRGVALRFWKGCKDSQTCFVDVTERFSPPGRLPRTARYILIYLPRSGTLEVWSLIHGPLLKSWSTSGILRFLPQHANSLNSALRHFNALCVIGNEYIFGIRLNFDLWFPHTSEADDFKNFSRLRSWISSRAFKISLKSKRSSTLTKLEGHINTFSDPDWLLKAIWAILRTGAIDLTDWLNEKLPTLNVQNGLSGKAKRSFENHLAKISGLISFYHSLSKLYKKNLLQHLHGLHREENEFITPVAEFFQEEEHRRVELKNIPSSTFFRAVAYSRLFPTSSDDHRHRETRLAYENILGQAIFTPFFAETSSNEAFLDFLDGGPFTFDYHLILATRCLLTESRKFSPYRLVHLTQVLFCARPNDFLSAFVTVYRILLRSRNYPACLILCASLVAAAESLQLRQNEASKDSDSSRDTLDHPHPRTDFLQSNLTDLRLRCKHLQDMVAFTHSLESFRKRYNLPAKIIRAFSVHRVFQRGPDHFTREFARYLAASPLTGREIVEIYRHFGWPNQNDDFIDAFQVLCIRLPHSFEVNRIIACAAWWMVRQIASPWSRMSQPEKFSQLKRIVDYINVTSNAGHGLAFIVASQCFDRPLGRMLKEHFTALQYVDFFEPVKNHCLLDEALSFCEFFNQYRRISIAAMEEIPIHRDEGWEDSALHYHPSIDGGMKNQGCTSLEKVSTFPLRQSVSAEGVPTFSHLDAWFQFFVIQAAMLAFGIPPLSNEVPVHPIQLLPDSWQEGFPFNPPSWASFKSGSASQRSLYRRGFIHWFLRSAASFSGNRDDGTRLFEAAKALAHAWALPSGFVRSLCVLTLYAAWADCQAESEFVVFADAAMASDLFYLLLGRIQLLDEAMGGNLLIRASQSLRSMVTNILKGESVLSLPGVVTAEKAPPLEDQMMRAQKLVDLLKDRLVVGSIQRDMIEEIGELLTNFIDAHHELKQTPDDKVVVAASAGSFCGRVIEQRP